jgi:hypothetical protein
MRFTKQRLILFAIILLAASFRLYNLNWDQGHHLHPDERAIVMTVDRLSLPDSLSEFFSKESPWNPQFFAYGSLPMYLLRTAGSTLSAFDPAYGTYASINLVGRFLSALADLTTIILIFKIGRLILGRPVGLLAAFFYAVSVLPIQLSHFFAVDTFLTLFITATLYLLLKFNESPSTKNALLAGLFFGLSLATKISSALLIVPVGLTLTAVAWRSPHSQKFTKSLLKHTLLAGTAAFLTFAFFMPYALIDFQNFWQQTITQSQLTKDPFYFPYTLQYVGKTPYWYEFKNIFLWGLGPALASLSFTGAAYFAYLMFGKNKNIRRSQKIILFSFFIIYSLIVGNFAVGFMRYMLPVYPLLALFAATFAYRILQALTNNSVRLIAYCLLLIGSIVWPLSFAQIYTRPNTRIQASNWIYEYVPQEKTIAVEHWDDQLPIGKPISYRTQIFKLYDPDTEEKWTELESQLSQTDFIILASNRLYTPLQKLTDCKNLPVFKCYPRTAEYYKKLFSGELGFRKVAEFSSYPTVPLINLPINDQNADESFTVYDHPKVIIFQKIK